MTDSNCTYVNDSKRDLRRQLLQIDFYFVFPSADRK